MEETDARIWFVNQLPMQTYPLLASFEKKLSYAESQGVSRISYETQQRRIFDVLKTIDAKSFQFIGPSNNWFDAARNSFIGIGRSAYFFDEDHATNVGAE